jgi:hypothetical protein
MKTPVNAKLTLVAACLAAMAALSIAHAQPAPQLVTNGPQVSPGDSVTGLGHRNVADSERYEKMLQANVAFRQQRMQKECGSIDDQNLHQQCLASFR